MELRLKKTLGAKLRKGDLVDWPRSLVGKLEKQHGPMKEWCEMVGKDKKNAR
jgi:hypothetical protein